MKRTTPNWTPADVWTLYDLIDAGYSYAAIGRKLGRTTTAVTIKSKRLRHRLLTTPSALSARQIADILGLTCSKIVARWITTYGLKARNGGTPDRPLWRVQWADLAAWLDDPHHGMAYDPTRCTNPVWREHLIEIRAGQPRWLTPGDVARRMGVTSGAVQQWIEKGFLPATRHPLRQLVGA